MNNPSQSGENQGQETQAPAARQGVAIPLPNFRPLVSYALIGLTLLVFLGQEYGTYIVGNDFLFNLGAMYGPLVTAGEYWRLITPVLLHIGEIHFAVNMYSLYVLGPGLERRYGHARFLALYLVAGFAGNVLSYFFSPSLASGQTQFISAGASTAIFGLLAAEGILIFQNRKLLGQRSAAAIRNILVIAAINLIIGFTTAAPQLANTAIPRIDNWGHIGGITGGILFAWFAGPLWRVEGSYPSLSVVDRREPLQIQLTAIVVAAIFAGIAFLRVMRG